VNRAEPLTRADIAAAALAIIRADGIEGLTMRRLATHLGCTPTGIYHHLPDRAAVLAACMEQVWDDVMHAVNLTAAGGDLIEVIVESAIQVRQVWLENFDLATLSVAVAEPDEGFMRETLATSALWAAAGFPDVGHQPIDAFGPRTIGSIP
jgi:AcrR family transcriptional regulator